MMDETKPHKGRIDGWRRAYCGPYGLGYLITGRFMDHERFAGHEGHTSWVVTHEDAEVETRNSRYTLVGDELPEVEHAPREVPGG